MQEIRCHRCGAVYLVNSSEVVCPQCGAGQQSQIGKFWSKISRYVLLAGGILGVDLWNHWLGRGTRPLLSGLIGAAVTYGVLAMWDAGRRGHRQPFGLLDTSFKPAPGSAKDIAPSASIPPDIPPEWRPLVDLGRPRDVYLPTSAKLRLVWNLLFFLVLMCFFAFFVRRYDPDLWREFRSPPTSGVLIAILILIARRSIRPVLKELSARALLRDGEVAIGRIFDWRSGSHRVAEVTYRFWTRTGTSFVRTQVAVSQKEYFSEKDYVPVFYRPEEPTKSLAVCSVHTRVGLPAPEYTSAPKFAR
jgi:ribosomal protein L37E